MFLEEAEFRSNWGFQKLCRIIENIVTENIRFNVTWWWKTLIFDQFDLTASNSFHSFKLFSSFVWEEISLNSESESLSSYSFDGKTKFKRELICSGDAG